LLIALAAGEPDDGEVREAGLSALEYLLLFVGTPLLAALVIVLLVYAPHWARRPRYRPGRPYDAAPQSFGELGLGDGADAARGGSGTAGGAGATW
jgi:hypothetical protein